MHTKTACKKNLSQRWELNSWPLPYQGSALPLSYFGLLLITSGKRGSNPRPTAWKAVALPTELFPLNIGGEWWIRTTEGVASRFTVCPIWPLWKLPIAILLRAGGGIRTPDQLITNQLLWPTELHRQTNNYFRDHRQILFFDFDGAKVNAFFISPK